jgi:hypothetical protein
VLRPDYMEKFKEFWNKKACLLTIQNSILSNSTIIKNELLENNLKIVQVKKGRFQRKNRCLTYIRQ